MLVFDTCYVIRWRGVAAGELTALLSDPAVSLWKCPDAENANVAARGEAMKRLFLYRIVRWVALAHPTHVGSVKVSSEFFDRFWTIEEVGAVEEDARELLEALVDEGALPQDDILPLRAALHVRGR